MNDILNNKILITLEITWLFFALSTFTLYWISRNKSKISSIATALGAFRIAWILIIPWVYKGHVPQISLLATASTITVFLLLYVILHEQICLLPEPPSEKYFDFLSLGLLPIFVLLFLNTFTVLSHIKLDTHFMGAALVTILFAYLTRRRPTNELFFQLTGLFVATLWIALIIVDPFLFSYGAGSKSFIDKIVKSVSLNSAWAYFPIMFFLGNLFQKNILEEADNNKIFKIVYFIYVGSMIFRDPEMSKFASKIPVFKDVTLASVGISNYALLPIYGTVRIIKKRKNRISG